MSEDNGTTEGPNMDRWERDHRKLHQLRRESEALGVKVRDADAMKLQREVGFEADYSRIVDERGHGE